MKFRSLSNEKPKVVLMGSPNAGKSSLFNTLLGTDRSIVSPIPGTTRDYLEADISFDGISCTLIDSAGIDVTPPLDEIDGTARQCSKEIAEQADVLVYCFEKEPDETGFDETKIIDVETKADLKIPNNNINAVSSKTGFGIETLRTKIAQHLKSRNPDGVVSNTAFRCRNAMTAAVQSLRAALELQDELLLASEIRSLLNILGSIDGSVYADDILDSIFSRFCIGK
jgi:tRNA modification GTPase